MTELLNGGVLVGVVLLLLKAVLDLLQGRHAGRNGANGIRETVKTNTDEIARLRDRVETLQREGPEMERLLDEVIRLRDRVTALEIRVGTRRPE